MFYIEREMASTGVFVGTHRGVTITIEQEDSGAWTARYNGKSNTSMTKQDALKQALNNIDQMAIV